MKIKYDMSSNYWNCHNEAQTIVMMKKRLLKNPTTKIRGIFYSGILYGFGIILVSICYFAFKMTEMNSLIFTILETLLFFLIVLFILYFLLIFITYFVNNKQSSHKGILKIDDFGLSDYSENGKITSIPWNHIQLVGIRKYVITFVTDTKLVVFINIDNKKIVLEALKKYQKNLLVIDQSGNI